MTWKDITVNRFIELAQIQCKGLSKDDCLLFRISVILDIPIEELEELYIEDLNKRIKEIEFVEHLPPSRPAKKINVVDTDLYLIEDLNKITLGEFIDLEYFFSTNYLEHLPLILSILYRRKTIYNSPFILDELEPYGNWIYHRAKLFTEIPIYDVYGVIPKYIEWRKNILSHYEGLFNTEPDDEEPENEKEESIKARFEREKEKAYSNAVKKWNYDVLLLKLAGNDPTKIDEVTKMPLIQAFNVLSMKKELGLPD